MALSSEVVLNPGEILYSEGDGNDCGYIIESGEVILYSNFSGRRVDCERRGAGSVVGELSILTGQPRTVTVEALTPCKFHRISAAQIIRRFEKLDPILRACIETSISFTGRLSEQIHTHSSYVPFVPSTLSNASELIVQFKFEADILKGVERGEFSLVYQPIMRLSDSRIIGVEALMRWQHPTLGDISPFRFIETAESTGSIGELTNFAVLQACSALRRMKANHASDDEFFMSINVSGKDIGRVGFIDFVAHAIDLNDLDPRVLKLELTETALVKDPERAAGHLAKLKELGCGISIDDFGTGYSNLAYLKQLPLTTLKIDRAFAGDAHANAVSRSIVRMLLGLGHEMGVDIIAEGLETEDDVATLRDLGCKFAQGYYFHRPISEAEITNLLAAQSPFNHKVAQSSR